MKKTNYEVLWNDFIGCLADNYMEKKEKYCKNHDQDDRFRSLIYAELACMMVYMELHPDNYK